MCKGMKNKECPSCAMEIDSGEKVCPVCGYEFPDQQRWFGIVVFLIIITFLLTLSLVIDYTI